MNEETPPPTEEPTQESQNMQDKRNYWKGFWISLVGNSIIAVISFCSGVGFLFWLTPYALISGAGLEELTSYPSQWGWGAIWFLVNILIMIYLYWKNKKAFQGVVAGFALGFFITIIGGLFMTTLCSIIFEQAHF
jgi:hypothetical protein